MNILEELPSELIACVLQYHLPDDSIISEMPIVENVMNGAHRKSIIDAHTTIETIIDTTSTTRYKFNGKRHRENGPATIYANGTEYWYLNGKKHRENGPAIIYSSGREQYWENGKFIR